MRTGFQTWKGFEETCPPFPNVTPLWATLYPNKGGEEENIEPLPTPGGGTGRTYCPYS